MPGSWRDDLPFATHCHASRLPAVEISIRIASVLSSSVPEYSLAIQPVHVIEPAITEESWTARMAGFFLGWELWQDMSFVGDVLPPQFGRY